MNNIKLNDKAKTYLANTKKLIKKSKKLAIIFSLVFLEEFALQFLTIYNKSPKVTFQTNSKKHALKLVAEYFLTDPRHFEWILSFVFLLAFAMLLISLLDDYYVGLSIQFIFVSIFGMANHVKLTLRQETILPSDIYELKNINALLEQVNIPQLLFEFVVSIIAFIFVMFLILKLKGSLKGHYKNIYHRILVFILSASTLFSFSMINDNSTVNKVSNYFGNYYQFWASFADASYNSPIVSFWNNYTNKAMNEPKGYSKSKMISISKKYSDIAKNINVNRKNENFKKQTVIYTLSESLTDLNYLKNVKYSNDNIQQNLHTIQSKTTSGTMISAGFGGGTADMEWMTLTSNELSYFRPSIQTPYIQIVGRQKYNPTIFNQFEKKDVIHPFTGSFYSREAVYKKYNIDNFYNTDNNGIINPVRTSESGTSQITDETAYKNVEKRILKASNKKSQMLQLITMQNHQPYPTSNWDNLNYSIIDSGKLKFSKGESSSLLEGYKATDDSTLSFLDELNKLDRPVTLVFYGDHWPGIFSFAATSSDINSHETPWFIWRNKASIEQNGNNNEYSDLRNRIVTPADFTSILYGVTNTKVNPYYALRTKLFNEHLALLNYYRTNSNLEFLNTKTNKQISEDKLNKRQKEIVEDMRMVQYDTTTGKNYLKQTSFFQIIFFLKVHTCYS